jgi:hypothetical protein
MAQCAVLSYALVHLPGVDWLLSCSKDTMQSIQDHNRKTPAANADILGEDASIAIDTADAPATRGQSQPRGEAARGGDAKPGKDINQAGFLKDKDAAKP